MGSSESSTFPPGVKRNMRLKQPIAVEQHALPQDALAALQGAQDDVVGARQPREDLALRLLD
eukprot:7295799-Karenia_brevis.AAC.1